MKHPQHRHPGPAAARLDISVPDQREPAREIDYIRWISQMQADLAESLGGVMLRAARPVALSLTASGTTQVSASPGRLVGWNLREVSGIGTLTVRLHNGPDIGSPLVACATAPAGGVAQCWMAPGGISFTEGLTVEVLSGSGLSTQMEGVVYLGAAD